MDLNIPLCYNDDFLPVHEVIMQKLGRLFNKGIVLLHGLPGTGKTTYIRYISTIIDKQLIYVPPDYAHRLASPEFISLMFDYPNSILVIEDAENIICERASNDNLSVANLLNLSDGLLSDCLNIQLICTFNTDISKIDKALLRKGRIIARYHFKELSLPKAQHLAKHLDLQEPITQPMTLAEIFNMKDACFYDVIERRIGF